MRRDECGESIIPGRQGQIYEYGDGELGVMFMSGLCTKMWNKFRTAALAMDMTLRQNGDSEGCLSFDPANDAQAGLAIKIAGVRPKRQVSPGQIARQVATLAKFRSQAKQEHTLEALKTIGRPQVAPADHMEAILDTKEPFYSVNR